MRHVELGLTVLVDLTVGRIVVVGDEAYRMLSPGVVTKWPDVGDTAVDMVDFAKRAGRQLAWVERFAARGVT